ncbi:MAG: N-6 DNA methylase [Candidatus Omnitrophica bacterium]|nr:N-6 DNA methylase [Candidatus Omnitrophota bacterium]
MLTQETKRKIDSARQILVGKVPDPKAQVEQITTALIYKFMDDMDKEAQELGGKARFFTNGYQKYAWTKLMDAKLGGHERLDLYLEAITSLSRNPHIPQLFRDIFKDAFLPYRSPETLSLFLKEINSFTYEHSEDLGDAFEYLLSILGSQGDAGQFRTPRHIIDFIVAAVAPKKDETICDPACGTAGFLISAFKHILKENKEKSLTPDERKNLMDHFVGYDISPDMVRLSKVNLYLHGFPSPTIFEYDTLSSEEKWDENFDVMLANPPFMSPTGGIRPHKRFSVQANRSEVLFVDYILEHLRPNGRAGIIVPEGIIFQSATAYKALRKLLIEDGLLAVVSLPAGVFNPYAGVKTSILLFDNGLAKKTKDILFLKILNDGYDLGAQRREIDKNDLPLALEIIKKYRVALKDSEKFELNAEQTKIAHLVAKDKIAESGDYNLSGDRYKEVVNFANQKWPMVAVGDICELGRGRVISKKDIEKHGGIYPVYSSQTTDEGTFGFIDSFDFDGEYVTWTTDGANAGTVFYRSGKFNCTNVCGTLKAKTNKVSMKYLAKVLNTVAYKYVIHVGNPKLMNNVMAKIKIPLPPLEVQKEIVEQIEVKQKAIEAAKAVIENLERERDAILAKRLEK